MSTETEQMLEEDVYETQWVAPVVFDGPRAATLGDVNLADVGKWISDYVAENMRSIPGLDGEWAPVPYSWPGSVKISEKIPASEIGLLKLESIYMPFSGIDVGDNASFDVSVDVYVTGKAPEEAFWVYDPRRGYWMRLADFSRKHFAQPPLKIKATQQPEDKKMSAIGETGNLLKEAAKTAAIRVAVNEACEGVLDVIAEAGKDIPAVAALLETNLGRQLVLLMAVTGVHFAAEAGLTSIAASDAFQRIASTVAENAMAAAMGPEAEKLRKALTQSAALLTAVELPALVEAVELVEASETQESK